MLFVLILQRRKPRLHEGQAQGPTEIRGKAQAPAPGPRHTDCAPPSRERGVWSLYSEQSRREGRARGRSEGNQGGPAPSPAWATPCGPASHLLPLSPVVTKELSHFRQREASRIRWALRIHPSEGSIRWRRQRLGSERHPLRPRLLDALPPVPAARQAGGRELRCPASGVEGEGRVSELRAREGASQDVASRP